MPSFRKDKFLSPHGLFIVYVILSSLAILIWRLIFPGEPTPLAPFSVAWRFLRGAEDILNLFPALALSALVYPFGYRPGPEEQFSSFSPRFLKKLSPSIVNAIAAASVYALLFLLVLPIVMNQKTDFEARGRLFKLSAERARFHAGQGEWPETDRFLDICDRIWQGSPEIASLRTETDIRLKEIAVTHEPLIGYTIPGRQELGGTGSLNASEALTLAQGAMREERFFDAHWLATLASDLADTGSVESQTAARLASQAWNAVSSLEPNIRETEAYRVYHLKRDAYRAFVSSNWIQAYYLFRELLSITPRDLDGLHYISLSEQGLLQQAFFMDEMELRESPAGALFSLPYGTGRMVMRFSSLSIFPDIAYGIGLEILTFDREGRLLWRLDTPYAKISPVSLDTGPHVLILMRALDRFDGNRRWEPLTLSFAEAAPSGAQLSLNLNWDDFLLLTEIRRGHSNLYPAELLAVSNLGANYGYVSEIFEAELISRFSEPVLFLPLLILTLALGWRFRAIKKPIYMWFPMLGVLPLVFNGVFHLLRDCFNNIAFWAVVTLGFSMAIFAFVAGFLVLFLLSLIILAAQRG